MLSEGELQNLNNILGEGNGNPLQCSCLENPRDGGAWWAAVYGVAQSQTSLKQLSSSSSSSSSNILARGEGLLCKSKNAYSQYAISFMIWRIYNGLFKSYETSI